MIQTKRGGAVQPQELSAAFDQATAQVEAALAALREAEESLERQLHDLRAYRGASSQLTGLRADAR